MDIVSLWKKTLQLIKGEVASASFETFFKDTVAIDGGPNELILLAPNGFAEDILRTRYLNLIESCLSQLSSYKFEIKIISDNEVRINPLKSSNNENKLIKSFSESFKFISLNCELSIFSTENLKQTEWSSETPVVTG